MNELTANPEEAGRYLFEIVPGKKKKKYEMDENICPCEFQIFKQMILC